MDMKEWNDLGFDPMKDGYWPTAQHIKDRLEEKDRMRRKARLITLGIVFTSMAFLLTLIWLLS